MPKAWPFFLTILVLAWLASSAGSPLTEALIAVDTPAISPAQSLGFREDMCTGNDVVEVGIPQKPLILPCDASNFEQLYLAYCTSEEYTRLTGRDSQWHVGVKEQLVPEPSVRDVREIRAFTSQLRLEAGQQLGTEDPPTEVDLSEHFPPAMRQMTNDCGSCAMASGVSAVQARQFPLWGGPWTTEEIVSPLSFSRKSDSHDCSLTMAEPFTFWRQEGAWTHDVLPYGVGDCHSVSLSTEELALGYPLHAADYRQVIFVRDDDYGTYIGTTDNLKWAIASGKNVQLVFGPLGGSSWAHTLAIMGYNEEGVMYINSWGADWGPNGDGTGVFTWDRLLSGEPVGSPFFSSPDLIWLYFNAASDWEGECGSGYLQYDYRGVCQAGADLALDKVGPAGSVLRGSDVNYAITVTNNGPDAAEDVVVTDDLPTGVDFVSASPECSELQGTVTCVLGDMSVGAKDDVQITVHANVTGHLTDLATVSGTVPDPNSSNNQAQETTEVIGQADLSVTMRDSEDPVKAANPLVYTLSVSNSGPDHARNVLLVDTLPHDVTFNSVSGTGWSCWESAGIITCSRGELAANTSSQIVVVADAPADAGTVTNTAEVSSDEADPYQADNMTQEQTTVIAQADLGVTKVDDADPVAPGETFSYHVTVTNAGPSEATRVVVEDTLPVGVMFESAGGQGWSCEEMLGDVHCERAGVAASTQALIVIQVTAPDHEIVLNNTTSVSSETLDPTAANNAASESTTVIGGADLSLTKTDSTDPAIAGQPFSYTLTVTNTGPSPATDVSLLDALPPALQVISASQGCAQTDGTITWTLDELPADASAAFELVVQAHQTGTLTNMASVSCATPDPDTNNNTATQTTDVEAQADLLIVKADSADPVTAKQPFSYTLGITNLGPSGALNVVVTDTLPPGVAYRGASGAGWRCSESGGTVTCQASHLGPGAGSAITLRVDAPVDGGILYNTAAVSSSAGDPDSSTNQCTESTAIMKLLLGTTVLPDPVVAGKSLTYTIWVTNSGAVDLHATVTNTLPANVTPSGLLTWTATIPAPQGVWARTIAVTAQGGYEGVLTNVLEVVTREGAVGKRVTVSAVTAAPHAVFLPLLLRDR